MNLYYLDANNQPVGPITADDIPDLYARHVINDDTLVALEGSDEWFPVSHVVEEQHHDDEPEEEAAPAEETTAEQAAEVIEPAAVEAAPAEPVAPQHPARKRYVIGNTVAPPGPVAQIAPVVTAMAVPYVPAQPPPVPRRAVARPAPVYQAVPSHTYAQHSMSAAMPGIGRLAFFAISIAWLAILALSFLGLIGGAAFVALSEKGDAAGAFGGAAIIWVIWGFVMNIIWVVVCVSRARNIGWSGWLIGLIAFFLSVAMPLLWTVLQMMPTGYSRTKKLDAAAIVIAVIGGLVTLGGGTLLYWGYAMKVKEDAASAVWDQRATHVTQLTRRGPSPQKADANVKPPAGVSEVKYSSGPLMLSAWYAKPKGEGRGPALVYYHGGFAFGPDDFEVVRGFLDAGFAVMTPMLRGENGNPGDHEHFYGELEDAEAAIRWIKQQPEVDATKLFTFGHSAGGVLSAMVSFNSANDVLLTGSAGGLYDASIFTNDDDRLPFDAGDPLECALRAPAGNAGFIAIPHIAYVGRDDPPVVKGAELAKRAARRTKAPLTVESVPGDHGEMLEPAVDRFLKEAQKRAKP